MKHLALLLCLLSLGLPVRAAPPVEGAGLTEIRDLGRLNGQALACSQTEAAARIKTLMLKHAPRAQRYGTAFEEATQEAFLAQTKSQAPCRDDPAFSREVDDVANRLQAALPVPPAASH